MTPVFKSAILSFLLAIPLSASAASIYIGIGAQERYLDFQKDYGLILGANGPHTQFSMHVGYRSYKYFGFELGAYNLHNLSNIEDILDQQTEFGIEDYIGIGQSDTYSSRLDINGRFIKLVGDFPINRSLYLKPYVSIIYTTAKFKLSIVDNDGIIPSTLDHTELDFLARDNRLIPKVGIDLCINLSKNYGLTMGAAYENSARLNPKSQRAPAGVSQNVSVKFKNSITLEMGLLYEFG